MRCALARDASDAKAPALFGPITPRSLACCGSSARAISGLVSVAAICGGATVSKGNARGPGGEPWEPPRCCPGGLGRWRGHAQVAESRLAKRVRVPQAPSAAKRLGAVHVSFLVPQTATGMSLPHAAGVPDLSVGPIDLVIARVGEDGGGSESNLHEHKGFSISPSLQTGKDENGTTYRVHSRQCRQLRQLAIDRSRGCECRAKLLTPCLPGDALRVARQRDCRRAGSEACVWSLGPTWGGPKHGPDTRRAVDRRASR